MHQTESGLQYEFLRHGAGRTPQSGDVVTVHYTGWLSDGTQLESSINGEPTSFMVLRAEVIRGWDEGIQYMPEGSIARFVIPPHLAFGEDGSDGVIPPDETLTYQLELVSVEPSS